MLCESPCSWICIVLPRSTKSYFPKSTLLIINSFYTFQHLVEQNLTRKFLLCAAGEFLQFQLRYRKSISNRLLRIVWFAHEANRSRHALDHRRLRFVFSMRKGSDRVVNRILINANEPNEEDFAHVIFLRRWTGKSLRKWNLGGDERDREAVFESSVADVPKRWVFD